MSANIIHPPVARRAFTLIEMIVVTSIIAVLAAMSFPAFSAIKKKSTLRKVHAELEQIETAIELYKAKHGFYPPDSPRFGPRTNQLYFELAGTELVGAQFQTRDGSARIPQASVPAIFGPGVSGFVNCSRGSEDETVASENFLRGIKSVQYGGIAVGAPEIRVLACSVEWPKNSPYQPLPQNPGLNPWRYVSSNPTNNPASYDLWVDVLVGGKTNRISNWSRQPIFVGVP